MDSMCRCSPIWRVEIHKRCTDCHILRRSSSAWDICCHNIREISPRHTLHRQHSAACRRLTGRLTHPCDPPFGHILLRDEKDVPSMIDGALMGIPPARQRKARSARPTRKAEPPPPIRALSIPVAFPYSWRLSRLDRARNPAPPCIFPV